MRVYYCISLSLWYFSFLSTFGLQRAYEPFLGKSLLASGIASNDWSVRMAVFGCYIRVSYASLCVSSPPTSLLGLRELVNRPKKKKKKIAIRFRDWQRQLASLKDTEQSCIRVRTYFSRVFLSFPFFLFCSVLYMNS